ncbi:hypothetical protein B0H10DRAFT_322545 [Mycena sp. CBHHK59/15]|nr:hypothetical protein B0H10DRAFT_322545 [Mycena sp. CBHHK59/15]
MEMATSYSPDFQSSLTTPGEPLEFTPRRHAMASFENLVALADYQERLKGARKIVWRDRGEPVADLPTLRDCLEHAGKGGFRSATLAFNIRASVNLVLALIRIRKVPRDHRLALIRNAVFGTDSLRFAAMLGTFAALYKFLINALPILIPAIKPRPRNFSSAFEDDDEEEVELPRHVSYPNSSPSTPGLHRRRSARLSLSAHAQMVLVRKRTRRWHSGLAGAIAGSLAILWEKRSRRVVIAQQMFVRGLQGTYNTYSEKYGWSVPHGAVLVFALSCGQILYAFCLRPDTLPRSYINWVQEASKAPRDGVHFNYKAVRDHVIDIPLLDRTIARDDTTPANLTQLLSLRARALAGAPNLPLYGPCYTIHPALTSCWSVPLDRFVDVFKWMLPIYSALHFVPSILFRWRMFREDPGRVLVRAGMGSVRSSAFLGVFVVIYQSTNCFKHQLYERLTSAPSLAFLRRVLPQRLIDVLISKGSFWLPGFLAGLALLIEDQRRRAELAMYVLPKGLESVWVAARGRGLVFRTGNWGEAALTGLAMGMVMSIYQNDPQHLSGLVRKVMYQFIGPN